MRPEVTVRLNGEGLISDAFLDMLDRFVGTHSNLKLTILMGATLEIIHSVQEDEGMLARNSGKGCW